jgi:hypothetical protein
MHNEHMENERNIEIENILRESGTEASAIEKIMGLLIDQAEVSTTPATEHTLSEDEIKMQIMNEKDWRKKAQLSAMIISNSLKRE